MSMSVVGVCLVCVCECNYEYMQIFPHVESVLLHKRVYTIWWSRRYICGKSS